MYVMAAFSAVAGPWSPVKLSAVWTNPPVAVSANQPDIVARLEALPRQSAIEVVCEDKPATLVLVGGSRFLQFAEFDELCPLVRFEHGHHSAGAPLVEMLNQILPPTRV